MRLLSALLLLPALAAAQTLSPWAPTGPIQFPTNVSGQVHGIGRVSELVFHPTDTAKLYAVSASGGLWISSNKGASWTVCPGTETLPQSSSSALCVDHTNDQILYLCLGDANYYSTSFGVYKSTNGGTTWAASNTGIGTRMVMDFVMDPLNNQRIVAATSNGVWRTTNAGTTWTQTSVNGAFTDLKRKPGSSTTLYASTAAAFYVSTDFGGTWTQTTTGFSVPAGNDGTRIAVSAADPARVYVGCTDGNGRILLSTNSGASFSTVYNSTAQCLPCYDASPSSGAQGDYNFDLTANPANAQELLLVSHCVWRSTDGGTTWSKRTDWWNEMHTDMHHIEWNPHNGSERWCANDGGVYVSTDPLATVWIPKSDGLGATEIYHAAQSPATRELISIGTQDNGELYYTATGWKTNRGGDWTTRCVMDYGNTGTVYYTAEGDRRSLTPLGGDQSYNSPWVDNNNVRIDFVKGLPGAAFAAKDSIWRSTNLAGTTPSWTLLRAATSTMRALVSSRADSNILFAVNSAGQFIRSKNALATTPTFSVIATPGSTANAASIATVRGNAAIVFLSCGSNVYRSADTGNTWTSITGTGLSGLNIRQIFHDDFSTNERLFVNAGSYVHHKNNTTTAWTNHSANAGLPTIANATDLMLFNPAPTAASALRISFYGRGVWETGVNNHLPPAIDFTADKTQVCPGDTVRFKKEIFGAPVTNFLWTFSGGTPASSTDSAPVVVYPAAGTYAVKLRATNANGTDSLVRTAYIQVGAGQATPVAEGFQSNAFPPPGWTTTQPSGAAWQMTTGAGGFGLSTQSAMFDNYSHDAEGAAAALRLPRVDLAGVAVARLKFDVAYAPYSAAYPDSLRVRVSTNCGASWQTVYTKTGAALATAPTTTNYFVPTAAQWRTDSIDLSAYTGGGLWVSLENIGRYGQPVYVDNVNLGWAPVPAFAAADTTLCAGESAAFSNTTASATGYAWSFPGGTPASSTAAQPTVVYNTPGIYPVTLVASNSVGADTLVRGAYITVSPVPTATITALGNVLSVPATTGATYQWSANGAPIASATGPAYTATAAGTYTVQITSAAGCVGTTAGYAHTPAGIAETLAGRGFRLSPNPTGGAARLTATGVEGSSVRLQLVSGAGAVAWRGEAAVDRGSIDTRLDWSGLARGSYRLLINAGGKTEILPVVLR